MVRFLSIFRHIKAALLPASPPQTFSTKPVRDLRKSTFGDIFNIPVPANKICTKTLQVNVWSRFDGQPDVCVVRAGSSSNCPNS